MRIVLIGVSHWHPPFYSDPVPGMKDATIAFALGRHRDMIRLKSIPP